MWFLKNFLALWKFYLRHNILVFNRLCEIGGFGTKGSPLAYFLAFFRCCRLVVEPKPRPAFNFRGIVCLAQLVIRSHNRAGQYFNLSVGQFFTFQFGRLVSPSPGPGQGTRYLYRRYNVMRTHSSLRILLFEVVAAGLPHRMERRAAPTSWSSWGLR